MNVSNKGKERCVNCRDNIISARIKDRARKNKLKTKDVNVKWNNEDIYTYMYNVFIFIDNYVTQTNNNLF